MEKDLATRRLSRVPLRATPKRDWRYHPEEALRLFTITAFLCTGVGVLVGFALGVAIGEENLLHFLRSIFR